MYALLVSSCNEEYCITLYRSICLKAVLSKPHYSALCMDYLQFSTVMELVLKLIAPSSLLKKQFKKIELEPFAKLLSSEKIPSPLKCMLCFKTLETVSFSNQQRR